MMIKTNDLLSFQVIRTLKMVTIACVLVLSSCSDGSFEDMVEDKEKTETETLTARSANSVKLNVSSVSATATQNPNVPSNVLDGDNGSRWSGYGNPVDLILDLGTTPLIDYVKIAFYKGNTRKSKFEVWTRATNDDDWEQINNKTSSGTTSAFEIFDLNNSTARFLKMTFKGNTVDGWNSITAVEVWGTPDDDNGGGGGGGGGGTYNYPYAIPKFQDAISKSKLQAPTSSTAATASELMGGYTSSWFYVVENDNIAFYQTGSSNRTELRFENNWYVNSGNRTAHANLKIVSQSGNETTFMQIHDDAGVGNGPNKPLLRMYKSLSKDGNSNHLWAAIKTDDGGSATTHVDCGSAPSGYFDCDISISGGKMVIKINGSTKVNRSVSYWDYPSYWKAGVYNQNSGGTTIYFNELTWN